LRELDQIETHMSPVRFTSSERMASKVIEVPEPIDAGERLLA
jgi:hypothetical protein